MGKQNLFNSIQIERNKKNYFDLSHDVKLSMKQAKLVPTLCMPAIPGDKFDMSCEMLVRFAPMLAPVMHRYDVSAHYFFVPNRLLWPGWEEYMRNGNPDGTGVPAHPYFVVDTPNYSPLMDYLGIPPMDGIAGGNVDQTTGDALNALPFAAYRLIFEEYFRDQNLIPAGWVPLVDGNNTANLGLYNTVESRCWEHDYFTSALPFAQRGPAVNLPIGPFDDVPVKANDLIFPATGSIEWPVTGQPGSIPLTETVDREVESTGTLGANELFAQTSLLNQVSTKINDLRRAIKLQEWFERMAVGGARYAEQLYAFFGIRNQDARLQRPEYITGIKTPVTISEVLNTTGTVDAPQGSMAGHGVSVTSGKYGKYRVQEHGYIMCIMSVMPRTCYQQGIPKHFLKINDFTEHFWPQFANIGEQEIKRKEVYGFTPQGNDTFGYTPRYAEYKYENSRVCGQFRTTYNFWHSGRIFDTQPALNQNFVQALDPTKRIFAVTDPGEDELICHVLHKIGAVRQMPKYGTPSI